MIQLGELYIESNDSKARLCCPITVDEIINDSIWFEVDLKYSKYLCYERSDAFIVAILHYAMTNRHDIEFTTPISDELYFNLCHLVIPTLSNLGSGFNFIKLIGRHDNLELFNNQAVGTGISAGIDSLQVIASLSSDCDESVRITHLMFNNVGSHGEGERAKYLFDERRKKAKEFCLEFNYSFVETNSNIHDVVKQSHVLTHTYTSSFAVICMQKLFSKYYYASGVSLDNFTVFNSDPAHHDLLLLNSFSVNSLKIHSIGADLTRLGKTICVAKYSPSYEYLNVCTESATNCGKCEKCMRTLLTLDAIDKLNLYNKVFDIAEYRKHSFKNKVFMCRQLLHGKEDYIPLKSLIKVSVIHYLMALMINANISLYSRVKSYLPNRIIVFLKSVFR